jgi:hypothetical protein
MAFAKSTEYWVRKIKLIEEAIQGTEDKLKTLTVAQQIEAHEQQLISLKKELARTRRDYSEWAHRR